MDVEELIAQLDEHGSALADAAGAAGLAAAVPTCPEWAVRDLLAHVGMVHRWAAGVVRGETDASNNSEFPAPEDGVLDWFREGHAALVTALREAPADAQVWTFLPAPTALAFWARRQAHETAIHRADAQSALGSVPRFEHDFALDGISELLEGFLARPRGKLVADPGFTLCVAPDGDQGCWMVDVGPELRRVTRHDSLEAAGRAAEADATLRGLPSDLYLTLWNRSSGGTTREEGDPRPMQLWRERARIAWS